MTHETETVLRRFLADNFLYREGIDALGPDDSLLARGVIDSTGVLELVAFLEERFGLAIAEEELVPENLDTVRRLTAFVERKQRAGAEAVCHAG